MNTTDDSVILPGCCQNMKIANNLPGLANASITALKAQQVHKNQAAFITSDRCFTAVPLGYQAFAQIYLQNTEPLPSQQIKKCILTALLVCIISRI